MIEASEQGLWKKLPPENAWPYATSQVVDKQDAGLAVSVEVFLDGPVVADALDRTIQLGDITGEEAFKRFIDQFGQLMGIWVT